MTPGHLGMTRLRTANVASLTRIREVDITLSSDLVDSEQLLAAVMMHELGHALGMDHPNMACTYSSSIMFAANVTANSEVTGADEAAMQAHYLGGRTVPEQSQR